jgi:hypothetical protein
MVKMVATARQKYKGRWLIRGQEFDVDTEAEADDLSSRSVQFAERKYPKSRERYQRRDMRAKG